MPSVLMCNMHPAAYNSFCRMFNHIGWKVYCPKDENYFKYGSTSQENNIQNRISYQEALDIKPDVVLCLCWQQLQSSKKLANKIGAKFVVRAGNNDQPFRKEHSAYLLSNDTITYHKSNIPNKLFFLLPPDYETFSKHNWISKSNICSTYIGFYERFFLDSFHFYEKIKTLNSNVSFLLFGQPYQILHTPQDVHRTLGISRCVLHIKELEGYGWSILESIISGIPIIVHGEFIRNKTCEKFLIENITCKKITTPEQFQSVYLDTDSLRNITCKGRKYIQSLINMDEQSKKLRSFLEDVVLR